MDIETFGGTGIARRNNYGRGRGRGGRRGGGSGGGGRGGVRDILYSTENAISGLVDIC